MLWPFNVSQSVKIGHWTIQHHSRIVTADVIGIHIFNVANLITFATAPMIGGPRHFHDEFPLESLRLVLIKILPERNRIATHRPFHLDAKRSGPILER